MSVMRALRDDAGPEATVFAFVERQTPAGPVYYRWALQDVAIDRRALAVGRQQYPDVGPLEPPFIESTNTNHLGAPVRLEVRGQYEGRLIEVSPITRGRDVSNSDPDSFPSAQDVTLRVADPVNETTGVNPLRALRWTGARVYVGLYLPGEPFAHTGFETEIPPTGGVVTLFAGEVYSSSAGIDELILSASSPWALAFNELRRVVTVTRSRFGNVEDAEVGKSLPIIYGVLSARTKRRRSGGAVRLIPLNGALPEDNESRNTLWGVASHAVGTIRDVWIEDRDRVRKRISPSDYSIEYVPDDALISPQPTLQRTSQSGGYTVLRFDDGLTLPDDDSTPLAEYNGAVYADVTGKIAPVTGQVLSNPVDVLMDFLEVHTDCLRYFRGNSFPTPFGSLRRYASSYNTAEDVRDWLYRYGVRASGLIEGTSDPRQVAKSLMESFGLRLFHSQGDQTVGSWRVWSLEMSLLDTPTPRAWRQPIAGGAPIVPFTREHHEYHDAATGREFLLSDTEHLNEMVFDWDDANQMSILELNYARDWVSRSYGESSVTRFADYLGLPSAIAESGETRRVINSDWIRDRRTAEAMSRLILWRYATPVPTMTAEAPLLGVVYESGYGVQTFLGRMAPQSAAEFYSVLTVESEAATMTTIQMLNVEQLWRPGRYVTANETDYSDLRLILGDEATLPATWGDATNDQRRYGYLILEGGGTIGKRLGVEP